MSAENEKLLKKIQRNEFNQTEGNLIILSFEKNLRQKEELHKRKLDELAKVEAEMAELNGQLAKIVEEIMKVDDQINTSRSIHSNLIANLEKMELSLAKKSQELGATSTESESIGQRLAEKQVELSKLEELLKEVDSKASLPDLKHPTPSSAALSDSVAALEKRLKDKIAKSVEEEVAKLLQNSKKKELQAKIDN